MTKRELFQVRLEAAEKARWEARAKEQGISLSQWVRQRCMIGGVIDVSPVTESPKPVVEKMLVGTIVEKVDANTGKPIQKNHPRTTPCEHRVSPLAFCKLCDG